MRAAPYFRAARKQRPSTRWLLLDGPLEGIRDLRFASLICPQTGESMQVCPEGGFGPWRKGRRVHVERGYFGTTACTIPAQAYVVVRS